MRKHLNACAATAVEKKMETLKIKLDEPNDEASIVKSNNPQ